MSNFEFCNFAINMPEQRTFDALGSTEQKAGVGPEKFAIMLDMLGQGFDPKNPFAGIGTAMGKSSLASKAEVSEQARSEDMFQKLLKSMTAKDQPGPTSMTAALSPDGSGLDYTIKGLEGRGDQEDQGGQRRLPGVKAPDILTDEDFMTRFGGGEGGGF